MVSFIGLDVGERRIGVARINSMAKIAEALEPIVVIDENNSFSEIKKIINLYSAEGIVVGLPRGLNGNETKQTEISIEFATNLKRELGIPVYMIDEAGTSKSADDIIGKNTKLSRDSVAAGIILEDFINYVHKDDLRV